MTIRRKIEILIRKIQFTVRDMTINQKYRKKLSNTEFTIISSDCTAGIIYHDLHLEFATPTINLFMNANDYLVFLENIHEFISNGVISECTEYNVDFPVAKLSIKEHDIILYLGHYESYIDFVQKWEERKNRINWDNLFVVMNDRNNCNLECIERFSTLNFQNKICFTHKPYTNIKSTFYITGSENKDMIDIFNKYEHQFGIKRYYDQFDWIGWLNGTWNNV